MGFYIGNRNITGIYVGGTEISAAYVGDVNVFGNTTPIPDYLKFTAKADNSTIGLTAKSTGQTLEYSRNGSDWSSMTTATTVQLASSGNSVYIRGMLSSNNTDSNYTQFKMTGDIKGSGNMNYIWNYENPDAALKKYCGCNLFSGCTALTEAAEITLPSLTLADNCYNQMFDKSGIVSAPELPSTTLSSGCYKRMFIGCKQLVSTPSVLSATALKNACYSAMFESCSSLESTVPMTALTLADGCCYAMYNQCTGLKTTANISLSATTLKTQCYYYMFRNCRLLTTAPQLPAKNTVITCYEGMFSGCTNLNYIYCLATNMNGMSNWVKGVASAGTFVQQVYYDGWTRGNSGIPTNWNIAYAPHDPYLTFTAKANNSSVGLTSISTAQTIDYSLDAENWSSMTTATTVQLSSGNTMYVRGVCSDDITDADNRTQFNMSGNIKVYGNINYLWNYNDPNATIKKACGHKLFMDCTALTDASSLKLPSLTLAEHCYNKMFANTRITAAPTLPATTLDKGCYLGLFSGCTSLTTAPALPATTLPHGCYSHLFEGCTSLTTAPALNATNLQLYCYDEMFVGCTSLTTAPVLPAQTATAQGCYQWMFSGCSSLNYIKCLATDIIDGNGHYTTTVWVKGVASSGTFEKNEDMTGWTSGVDGIPSGWTVQDAEKEYITFTAKADNSSLGLTKISLYHTLQYSTNSTSWSNMKASTNINLSSGQTVFVRGTLTNNNSSSTYTQFKMNGDIKVSGNINYLWNYSNPNAALKQYCGYNLFKECTALTDATELRLPSMTLANYCYHQMFRHTGIATAPELPATTLKESCYRAMFTLCGNLTTAPVLPATTLADYCYRAMFEGCSSLTTAPTLPATTLAASCYSIMFSGCTNLNYIKCLATNISATDCTLNWVIYVPAEGTFIKDANTTWPTGVNGIPDGWTVEDYVENNT